MPLLRETEASLPDIIMDKHPELKECKIRDQILENEFGRAPRHANVGGNPMPDSRAAESALEPLGIPPILKKKMWNGGQPVSMYATNGDTPRED